MGDIRFYFVVFGSSFDDMVYGHVSLDGVAAIDEKKLNQTGLFLLTGY